jgi:hypothetical protein
MPDDVRNGGDFAPSSNVEARLSALGAGQQAIRVDLAEIKGRLSNMPTSFQLVFILAAFVVTIFAASLGLLKLTSLH